MAINDCNETTSVQAEDSVNFQYFKKLQLKGLEAPLEEFLRLWYPDENELLEDLYYSNCGKILKIYEYHNLDYLSENCKPDSLYSWGPVVKLENMKKILADGDAWYGSPNPYEGKPHTLFMAKTPVSTFGYGDIAIRIKLRIGTPFVYQHHTAYNQGIPDYTHVDGVMMNRSWHNDYMLDNSIFIESWSYATPQLYDEIIRDIVRIKSKLPAEIYAHNLSYDPEKGLENLFNQSVDEKDFSENELKRKLLIHIGMILRGEGRIHYQQGSCRNKDLHYKTNQPTYFNPK